MTNWLSGTRGMMAVIATWTVGWGLGFGGLAELFVDPSGKTLDIWPFEMAVPGFVGGVVFALLLRIAEGGRRLDRVSFVRFTAWGALAGLTLGVLSATTGGPIPLALTTAEMIGLALGLSVVAAVGTLVFFRLLGHGRAFTPARRAH